MLFSSANEFLGTSSEDEEDEDQFENNEFRYRIQNKNDEIKKNKGKKNFYNKLKEGRRGTETSEAENHLSNVSSMNIIQLQQKVEELTKECKRLDIYVRDSAVLGQVGEEEKRQSEMEQEAEVNKNEVKDNTTDGVKLLKSHKKFQHQRGGGGTGNTKCHKKHIKKDQMVLLSNTIQHLEQLLQDHYDKEKNNESNMVISSRVRRKRTKK